MTFRLWYPQLDVYDTARRLALLLSQSLGSIGVERLFILDFFLANPPLLHGTTMPQEVRAKFRKLNVARPEKTFITFPAAPLLFHRMEGVQKEALVTLVGKALVAEDDKQRGRVHLSAEGNHLLCSDGLSSEAELALAQFLTLHFAGPEEAGNYGLRNRTRLRRPS